MTPFSSSSSIFTCFVLPLQLQQRQQKISSAFRLKHSSHLSSLFVGNIQDIRVPVAGTSASDFEVKESDKKKKGGKNINWNLQVNSQEAEWPSG